ncbi:MAG: DUF1836 domain-containing protein [Ruminococcaceae bacterium]|nr:DUF1836 domain-containing protein [Oscillospiraceae bacterium]
MPNTDIEKNDILEFHLPRWDELPEIELYMDQVVSYLEKKLEIFAESKDQKIITSTMINNYVKQKVVKPPVNKRYGRLQLAYLFVVCLLKRLMSISEICESIEVMLKKYNSQQVYDLFCDELENALHVAFTGKDMSNGMMDEAIPREVVAIRAAVMSLANLILARRIIASKKQNFVE